MVSSKDKVCQTAKAYIAYVEKNFSTLRVRVRTLRSDRAGEKITSELQEYLANAGIIIKTSPPYAPVSNSLAERIVQENWTRARVLIFATYLPQNLWGEAMNRAKCLRNRVPPARVKFETPLEGCDQSALIDFAQLLEFGAN